jgi:SAM-dependent methyltransferase
MTSTSRGRVLYRQHDFPIFQNRMYATAAEALACPRGDIELVEDDATGLVFNAAFRPELMAYDRDYQNEQGHSPAFRAHLDDVADIVVERLGRERIVEVGCGKGLFLELLAARGVDVTGFDPTYEGENPRIIARYFSPDEKMQAKGLVLRHVLEHIRDPFAFLQQLRDANGGGGLLYVEVPCLDWILAHRAWFDVFYEHVNYFRLADFARLFGSVVQAGRVFGGQYLAVVVDLATLRPPRIDERDRVVFPVDFTRASSSSSSPPPATGDRGRVAVWGGASKGVIFSLLRARAGHPVDVVIDINPAKQGRYLPATGLRVQSPAEALPTLPAGSSIYVMNSMYLREIKEISVNRYHYVEVDHE